MTVVAMADLPKNVRLHFVRDIDLTVEARNNATGDIVASCCVKSMAEWLGYHGFRYVVGSSGIWTRGTEQ